MMDDLDQDTKHLGKEDEEVNSGSLKELPQTRYPMPDNENEKKLQGERKSPLLAMHDKDIEANNILGKEFEQDLKLGQ